jgi:hypothetical protein
MRRAFAKSLFSAGAVVALALIPASSAFSEAPHAGDSRNRDPALQETKDLAADELNSRDIASPDNALVRRLMAERPNEDLVICIAGCFSGRDRVVYAQPADRRTTPRTPASTSSADEQSMNGASDGMSGSITESLRGSQ